MRPMWALRLSNGTWEYLLHWRHVVDNTGDILHLRVTLPAHGRWIGSVPPAQSSLKDKPERRLDLPQLNP
jgi:hypothetical protein